MIVEKPLMIRFSVLIDHDLCGLVSKDHLLLAAKSILKIEGEIFLDDDQSEVKWVEEG